MPEPRFFQLLGETGTVPFAAGSEARQDNKLHFHAENYADPLAAVAAAMASIGTENGVPKTYNGAPLQSIEIESEEGPDDVKLVANYGGGGSGENQDKTNDFNFEIAAVSKKVTKSLKTVYKKSRTDFPGGVDNVPDFQQAIGIDKDGNVEGVEVGATEWSETRSIDIDSSLATASLFGAIWRLRNTVNKAAFLYFAAGECKFEGASGSYRAGDKRFKITLKFKGENNETVTGIGPFASFEKQGWDYIWRYDTADTQRLTAGGQEFVVYVRTPKFVSVERLHYRASFTLLSALIAGTFDGTIPDPGLTLNDP